MKINGLNRMARLSEMFPKVALYYNFEKREVTENENGGDYVGVLLGANTPQDIEDYVKRWLMM